MKRGNKDGVKARLGSRLVYWRKGIPMLGYELAALIGISQGSLSDIENNKSLPSAITLAKFHQRTNLNILWLLLEEEPMENPDS